jgi:PAS domain S-box-containing protein
MEFWRFIGPHTDLGHAMASSYNPLLVILSIMVACLAGYSALSIVERIRATKNTNTMYAWLAIGAMAMGTGIWAMHFTAMTAFSTDMPVSYRLNITLLSMVPAILGSWITLNFMSRTSISWWRLQLCGLAMAVGIGTMHYTGMEAMSMRSILRYDPSLFLLSIVVAYVLATAALYIRIIVSRYSGVHREWAKVASAIVMGSAVAGMHYTAMAAARFFPDHTALVTGTVFSPLTLGVSICFVTSLIMGVAVIGTIVDRRLEAASSRLHASEAWADAILNTVADGIISINRKGTILSFNQAAEKIFGYSSAEAIGQKVSFLMPTPIKNEHDAYLARYLHTGERHIIGTYREVTARHKDGRSFPVELGVAELPRDDGPVFIGSLRDITARKALEAQLTQGQKLESIGRLAAGVAHEINTPIQFIGDNTRFLEDAFGQMLPLLDVCDKLVKEAGSDGLNTELVTQARTASENADLAYMQEEIPNAIRQTLEGIGRVSQIVSAMKNFSHPGNKEKQSINLNQTIQSTVMVSRSEWKYVADLETEFDPNLPLVPCLSAEFSQVVLNMIVNAAQAIAEAQKDNPEVQGKIRITTRHEADWVEIRISDTGTGIPEQIRSKIFDPFFTTKEVGKGTGQGLSIAHSLINEKHGGTIQVESEVGAGSTFIIRLPLQIGFPSAEAATESALSPA